VTGMCTGYLPLNLNRGQAFVSRATMTDLCPGTHALDSCFRSSPAPACPWRPVRPEPAPGFDQGGRRGRPRVRGSIALRLLVAHSRSSTFLAPLREHIGKPLPDNVGDFPHIVCHFFPFFRGQFFF